MREALAARSDHDFIAEPAPPRRARAPARGRPAPRGSRLSRVFAVARRYPLEIAIGVGLATAVSVIAYNALVLQTARHPAPWFMRKAEAPVPPARPSAPAPVVAAPAATAAQPAAAPAPMPPRPASRDAIGDLIRAGDPPPRAAPRDAAGDLVRGGEPASRVAALPPAPPARPASPARDPIGDMIRLGEPPPIPPAPVGRPEPAMKAAQSALAKLGYLTGKPDGVAGPQTKQAIERFERDRKLPATGELSPRTVRELAAASGIAVE